jgi:hypothetical protein
MVHGKTLFYSAVNSLVHTDVESLNACRILGKLWSVKVKVNISLLQAMEAHRVARG